jgi:hypothetical protein
MFNFGISENVADDFVNMETSLKDGIINYQQRNDGNSSSTSAEVFAKEVFAPIFNSQSDY